MPPPAAWVSCSSSWSRPRARTWWPRSARAEKEQIARDLGADEVIRYDQVDDLADAVRAASDGGVHVAYDGVGKATFDASLASLRPRGMMALFGAASGPVPPVDPQRLNSGGSLFLTRPTLKHYIADPRRSCCGAPARSSARSPTAACRSRSAGGTSWSGRPTPTAISRAARRPGSC